MIKVSFVGGPECGRERAFTILTPVIKLPCNHGPVVVDGSGDMVALPSAFYCYKITSDMDNAGRTLYRYEGEH